MVKRADWVTTQTGGSGIVRRIAKDGSWADVSWTDGRKMWCKRMPTSSLIVETTISVGEWEVTDVTREKELAADV